MRFRDLLLSTIGLAGLGLILAAAPGRSQSAGENPPSVPQAPAIPMVIPAPVPPVAPLFSAAAAVPAIPAVPGAPAAPEIPAAPRGAMDGDRSFSSRHHDGPASDCSDLRIKFHDEPAAVESEERTFSKAEASALRVDEVENGGIQVQGWDRDAYSVTACKAADATRGDAKELLSQIKLTVQGGHVSVSGPSRHNDWTVHLLIRTPRAVDIELKAHNGPLSFYSVDGKIIARSTNGPISMADCSGEADISAVNGPISFSGTGGKLRMHTENGPISVALSQADWSGAGLVADAINGPLTLSVPAGFHSSFLVESNGHSPMSCHARVCDDARKTWDDEHRRIEYGSGTPVIRLSTENGPISVNAL
jgi:hypothetical protein